MDLTTRGKAVGQYELVIDGMPAIGHCKSIEGGLPKGNTIEEQVGTHLEYMKHISTVEIEPMTMELGMQDAVPVLEWIQASWRREYGRRSGMIRHANYDHKESFQHHFHEALLSEVTFPGLDAAGKEGAYLKIKMQPEEVEIAAGDNSQFSGQGFRMERQKLWNTSCFRLKLDGLDTERVAKIDSFTVKQGIKPVHCGERRFPEWEPTKITFPDLSVHMTMEYAQDIINWYEEFIIKGMRDPDHEKTGAIEFLAPNKQDLVFRIKLAQVGIKSLSINKSEKQDQVKRVKFDLYVGSMDLDGEGGLALA
jgi:hypothetical protein